MKIVVFAGGVGTRLWPLSRKNTPKQFEKIIDDRSTLQKTVDRLTPDFAPENIYIATGLRYETIVREQLPKIPQENFIFEPEMRDVGPAIGLVAFLLESRFKNEPIAILWSDHLVKNISAFKNVLRIAENMVIEKKAELVFIGQKPRFANQNMGWIELGDPVENISVSDAITVSNFRKLIYRPSLADATAFFHKKNFVWNLGYYVTTPKFLTTQFNNFVPDMYRQLKTITNTWGTKDFDRTLSRVYPKIEKISFDDAILVKLEAKNTFVISSDLGWSDIGAWEALKEALAQNEEDNITKGNVIVEDSRDSLLFNHSDQLVVGIDLNEMLVINTDDVLLVCPKTSVPKIKKLVESLVGTPHEHLI